MYDDQIITNPNDSTVQLEGKIYYKTSAIRIDDGDVSYRKTWSSEKIQGYAKQSDKQIISEFVKKYGEIYFDEYNVMAYEQWTPVIRDAQIAISEGKPFYVALNENKAAEVINASSNSEPRLTVISNGRAYAMSDVGVFEVPAYSIVMQYASSSSFPSVGDSNRLYIDLSTKGIYYWRNGYQQVRSEHSTLCKLIFGANQEYVYDGTQEVIVPVYMGDIN